MNENAQAFSVGRACGWGVCKICILKIMCSVEVRVSQEGPSGIMLRTRKQNQ